VDPFKIRTTNGSIMGESPAGNKDTLPCRSSLNLATLYLPERKCQAKNALLPENQLAQGGKKRSFVAIIYYILVYSAPDFFPP
jgi:hypothetical protein